jgi:tetratricopeptide (TPR) repeat protein
VNAGGESAWLVRGQAHQRAGRTVDALLCYREALAANRYEIQAHFHLGEVLRELGRDGDAFDAWRTVLTLQPRHLPTLLAFGAAARRIGKTAESAEAYRRAVTFEPQSREARHGLALTRLAAGDAEAYAEIQRSIDDGVAFVEPQELARLLLAAPASLRKQALIGELAMRRNDGVPAWLAAMAAEDAAARGERERALVWLESAESRPRPSLERCVCWRSPRRCAPESPWPAFAARCMALHAAVAPLAWPQRTAGAMLRLAYLIAPGQPLRIGATESIRPAICVKSSRRILANGSRQSCSTSVGRRRPRLGPPARG